MVWDFRTPTTSPVNLNPASNDNVFASNDVGHLVAPGTYTVTLSKYSEGKVTDLSETASFQVKLLPGNSLPAEDPAAVAAWKARIFELRRAAEGARNMLSESQNRLKYLKAAVQSVPASGDRFLPKISEAEADIRALSERFFGDNVKGRLDIDTPPSVMSRLYNALYDGYGSTGTPTATMNNELELAEADFGGILEDLKRIWKERITPLEQELEAAGAPYTPGRMPGWKKN